MEKILFRKLLLDYLSFFLATIISTSIVIWVFQAVNFLDIIIEDGRDYLVYINYSLLNFPKILSKIFPFTLFFSIFYITTKYELQNELIIFWNHGIHKMEVVNFISKISIFLTLIQLCFTCITVPSLQDTARSLLRESTMNFYGNFVKPKKFNDTIKNITIYSEKKNEEGMMINLYLKKKINNDEFQVTFAKKGKFQLIGNTPILVLYDGATITSKKQKLTNISFSKSDFSLLNTETNTTTYKKTQELSSAKLIKCLNNFYKFDKNSFEQKSIKIENCNILNLNNIFKEFYKRFIIPFYIPLLSVLPFLLIIFSKENQYYQKMRLITFVFGLIILIGSETTVKFITNDLVFNSLLSLIPIFFFILIYFSLKLKFKL